MQVTTVRIPVRTRRHGRGRLGRPPPEKFKAVGNEVKAEAFCKHPDKRPMLFRLELDDTPRIDVNQMVMMARLAGFIARTATAEITTLEDPFLLKQTHGPVDSRDGDPAIPLGGAPIQLLNIGMILSLGEHLGNQPTLPCHLEAALQTETPYPGFSAETIAGFIVNAWFGYHASPRSPKASVLPTSSTKTSHVCAAIIRRQTRDAAPGQSAGRATSDAWRNLAPPSGIQPAGPNAHGTVQASYYKPTSDDGAEA